MKLSQPKKDDGTDSSAPRYQSGVLRTNCIDCLDRTNVAQYAYGLAALGRQLHAMGLSDTSKIDPDSSIAAALMDMYQSMGDALAQQYGGSAAHNTVITPLIRFDQLFVLRTKQLMQCLFVNIVTDYRFSQKGRENGRPRHSLESFLSRSNDTTATPTLTAKSKMP